MCGDVRRGSCGSPVRSRGSSTSTPATSRPRSSLLGIEPTASSTCEPSTTRPSSQRTRTMVAVALDRARAGALEQRDAACEERLLEHRGNLGVLDRQHLLAGHEQRDLGAERVEEVGELHAGDARADHDRVLGDLRRRVRVAGGEDALVVDGDEVGDARARAGADDDEVGGDLFESGVGSRPRPRAGP